MNSALVSIIPLDIFFLWLQWHSCREMLFSPVSYLFHAPSAGQKYVARWKSLRAWISLSLRLTTCWEERYWLPWSPESDNAGALAPGPRFTTGAINSLSPCHHVKTLPCPGPSLQTLRFQRLSASYRVALFTLCHAKFLISFESQRYCIALSYLHSLPPFN